MQIDLEERLEKEREFLDNEDSASEEEFYSEDDFAVEFFYLWDTNLDSFEIFRLTRPYINADGVPPEALLIALSAERKVKLQKILEDIPFILHGYNKVISSAQPQNISAELPDAEGIPFN